jgi:uncharacterized membrane protein
MACTSASGCFSLASSAALLKGQNVHPAGLRVPVVRRSNSRMTSRQPAKAVRLQALLQKSDDSTAECKDASVFESSAAKAVAMLAAGALFLAPVVAPPSVDAAQGGGRVGGSSFSKSRQAPPPSASRTTVVAPSVTVAPVSPFGGFFAPPPLFGWSPFGYGFAGPTVVLGGGGGFGFLFSTFLFITVTFFVISVVTSFFRRD